MRSTWKLLSIAFLFGYATCYIIQSYSLFDKALNIVAEVLPAQKWNWCPKEANKILVSRTLEEISDPSIITDLCLAPMSRVFAYNTPGKFQAVLRAQNKEGQVAFLEYDPSSDLFRIESQVFSSKRFSDSLKKFIAP